MTLIVRKRGEVPVLRVMGSEIKFLCEGEITKKAWSLTECAAPRDVGPPAHHHAWDEAYYVLEGEVRFTVDGHDLVLRAGEFVHIPGGTVHGFKGASDATARMLIFDTPAHAEGFFREVEREVRELPVDLPKVPAIGARYGIHFLPPA
jgi:quercetin dioxygenase-like cupin family protein